MRVHVVGNVCIDTTFRLDRFPEAGETLNATGHSDGIGGKGANQAVAAARIGAPVTLWAAIGNDADGRLIREQLTGEIDLGGLTEVRCATDRSTIAVNISGENMIISGIACAAAFDPLRQSSLRTFIKTGDLVVMQGNLSIPVTQACLAAARRNGGRTVLNISPLGASYPALVDVDFAIVNEGEATTIAGTNDPARAVAGLLDLGAANVVVTLGAQGCLLASGKHCTITHFPAPVVTAVDTSGAGDVLCGVFAGCIAAGKSAEQALRIAVEVAAIAVSRPGTLQSCPSRQEITSLIISIETEQA